MCETADIDGNTDFYLFILLRTITCETFIDGSEKQKHSDTYVYIQNYLKKSDILYIYIYIYIYHKGSNIYIYIYII